MNRVVKKVGRKMAKKVVSKGVKKAKGGVKETKDSLNFLKAPKDSPSDVFGGLFSKKGNKGSSSGISETIKDIFGIK